MRRIFHLPLFILCLGAPVLAGCGVAKLWGDDDTLVSQDTARPGLTLREQADAIAEPVWEIEEKRSFMNQMAGVFVNGARSAGQALDVFDWSGDESPEKRQAKNYLEQIGKRENYGTFANAVLSDILNKDQAGTSFRITGIEALDYYHAQFVEIDSLPDNGNRKARAKRLLSNADEDRRAAIQASKSLRQQASVFAVAVEVLKVAEETSDMAPLDAGVKQLIAKAGELRSLAEDLDFD